MFHLLQIVKTFCFWGFGYSKNFSRVLWRARFLRELCFQFTENVTLSLVSFLSYSCCVVNGSDPKLSGGSPHMFAIYTTKQPVWYWVRFCGLTDDVNNHLIRKKLRHVTTSVGTVWPDPNGFPMGMWVGCKPLIICWLGKTLVLIISLLLE